MKYIKFLSTLLVIFCITNCSTYKIVDDISYYKEYKTDSTIIRVFYDSTIISVKNKKHLSVKTNNVPSQHN